MNDMKDGGGTGGSRNFGLDRGAHEVANPLACNKNGKENRIANIGIINKF